MNSEPLTLVGAVCEFPDGGALIGLTKRVPLADPSDFQSSWPYPLPLAKKNSVPLRLKSREGFDVSPPDRMSLTRIVPVDVPSLFHSSWPFVPSLAIKNSVPFTLVR